MTRRSAARSTALSFGVVALAASAACGGGDKDGAGASASGKEAAGGASSAKDVSAEHVAAVNAAIPADLKGKVEFEAGRLVENEKRNRAFRLAIPKGWKKGFMDGTLEPADADRFGSKTLGKTQLRVDRSCGGTCEKKDWAAVVDKTYYAQFTGGSTDGKVVKDEKRPNGRTLVFERTPSPFPEKDVAIYLYTTWWEPEGKEYYSCSAELGTPVKGLVDAFEKACSQVLKE